MSGLSLLLLPNKGHKQQLAGQWLLLFFIGAFVLAPYLFIHGHQVMHGVIVLFQQYFNSTSPNAVSFQRSDWLLPKYLLGYFGAATWIAMMLALLTHDRFQKCLAKFLLIITAFYTTTFSLLSFFNESNLSHLAFVWCLLLAIATEALVMRIKQKTTYIRTVYVVFIIAIIATPALCSLKIRNTVYGSTAKVKIQASIQIFERKLLDEHPGLAIVDISTHPDMIEKGNVSSFIVKIPWMYRNEYKALEQRLIEKHYVLINELTLPLGDLPHSQLQSIHFPASYRYYQFHP